MVSKIASDYMSGGISEFMNLTQQIKSPDNLSEALAECKVFAKRGHILANDAVSLLNRVVNNVSEKLQNEIINLQVSNYNDNATTGSLASQLSLIRSNFEILCICQLKIRPYSHLIFGH